MNAATSKTASARRDLLPLFERSGSREQKVEQATRALVSAVNSLRSSNVASVVEQRADSRPESHPTQAALDFAHAAVEIVYPDREWEEPVRRVSNAVHRAAVRSEGPRWSAPTNHACALAAGKELALAMLLYDRLPLEVYDSLVAAWTVAIPALAAEHHVGVGANPVTQEEIDMATAQRTAAQTRRNPKPATTRSAKPATESQARPRQSSPEREAMETKVREFLQAHPKDEYGPWAIVQALKLVPEGMGLKEREASKAFDAVRNAAVRVAERDGSITVKSVKPFRFQWAGKAGKRAASAPATASEATTQAAESQRANSKPQATRDASKGAPGVAAAKTEASARSSKPRRRRSENGVATGIDPATQGSPGRSDSQPMPTAGDPDGSDEPERSPEPERETETEPQPETGGVVVALAPEPVAESEPSEAPPTSSAAADDLGAAN